VIGGILLLELPAAVFDAIVPALILLSVALMALRPSPKIHEGGDNMPAAVASSFAVGIYGGYFGAAQGIILMSLLRLSFAENLQVLNAMKNVLAGVANAVAGLLFIVVADVAWDAAALIAGGSVAGSLVAARYGRRIPPEILRRVVIVYGTGVAIVLIVT
jgi:uncharacterized protein